MSNDPRAITYIGTTDFRNQNTRFGIRAKDRLRHTYIIGATGVGKSTLIENLIIQDLQNGNGVAIFDPHGASAEKILDYIPEHRLQDVIYFAPFDLEYPIAFNPLEDPGPDFRFQVSDGLLSAFKKIWPDAFSARMEYILSMTLLALLEYPGSTLLSVNRMLAEKQFRIDVVNNIRDLSVKAFWVDEFMKWEEKFAREASAAIQNKVGQFTSNPLIRNILGQPVSTINFRDIMDNKKIFIANLSKGRMGEQNAPLLGAMLITKLYLAAMSRADKSESEMHGLPPFYLFVDEFQNFANDSFENILSESRKYKLGLTIAHQYIEQMPENIQAAVFGNVGTKITFRTQKAEDAELLEKAFAPVFLQADFMSLGMAQVYMSLMIDGVGSAPFSARTLPPIAPSGEPIMQKVIASSRKLYARPRADVEQAIAEWYTPRIPTNANKLRDDRVEQKPQQPKPQQQFTPAPPGTPSSVLPPKPQAQNKSETMTQTEKEKREAYYAQKKAEIEAKGGVWISPEEFKRNKELKELGLPIPAKKPQEQKQNRIEESVREERNNQDSSGSGRIQNQVLRPKQSSLSETGLDNNNTLSDSVIPRSINEERKEKVDNTFVPRPSRERESEDTRATSPEETRALIEKNKPALHDILVQAQAQAEEEKKQKLNTIVNKLTKLESPIVYSSNGNSTQQNTQNQETITHPIVNPSGQIHAPVTGSQKQPNSWGEISPSDLAKILGTRW